VENTPKKEKTSPLNILEEEKKKEKRGPGALREKEKAKTFGFDSLTQIVGGGRGGKKRIKRKHTIGRKKRVSANLSFEREGGMEKRCLKRGKKEGERLSLSY